MRRRAFTPPRPAPRRDLASTQGVWWRRPSRHLRQRQHRRAGSQRGLCRPPLRQFLPHTRSGRRTADGVRASVAKTLQATPPWAVSSSVRCSTPPMKLTDGCTGAFSSCSMRLHGLATWACWNRRATPGANTGSLAAALTVARPARRPMGPRGSRLKRRHLLAASPPFGTPAQPGNSPPVVSTLSSPAQEASALESWRWQRHQQLLGPVGEPFGDPACADQAEEIIQDTRADEACAGARRQKPLRCGRAIYFRRPDMRSGRRQRIHCAARCRV